MRVLFVCTGNICRSPTAEAVLRKMIENSGLDDEITVDSAGTHGWHAGSPPDDRAIHHAARRGYDLRDLRARVVAREDFEQFDLLVAMDRRHHSHLLALCPEGQADRLRLFMEFAPTPTSGPDVPDPYTGNDQLFEDVLNLIEQGCGGLMEALRADSR